MKTYIDVPYRDNGQVKSLGAKWDAERKKWYVIDHPDMQSFLRWMPDHLRKPHTTQAEPSCEDNRCLGDLRREEAKGKKGKKSKVRLAIGRRI